MPFGGLDCDALHGIELWSFANDTGERISGIPALLRFLATPGRVLDHPPERNMRRWDELCRARRVVAIGGLDAHQFGKRIGPVVPVRVMAYHRSFRYIRTHVLCERAARRELERDRELVFDPLRAGRCYIAVDSLAPARGFRFEADDLAMGAEAQAGRRTLRVRTPLAARLRLLRDGAEIAVVRGNLAGRRGRGARRVPRGGAPALIWPRAHLDPVEPDLSPLNRRIAGRLGS